MNVHCNTDAKYILKFLNICDGNWHRCIYVDCEHCKFPTRCESHGFLFLPDENAIPCLLPLSDAKIIFSRVPESEECLAVISVSQFLSMYSLKLRQASDGERCPCMTFLKSQEDANYNW